MGGGECKGRQARQAGKARQWCSSATCVFMGEGPSAGILRLHHCLMQMSTSFACAGVDRSASVYLNNGADRTGKEEQRG